MRQLFQRAIGAQQHGDYALAIQEYRATVKLQPDLLAAWINLGVALVQAGRFPEAIESYRSALALDPRNRQVQFYLGLAYFKEGDTAHASRQFEEVLRLDPKDIRAATLLGASYLQSGENARALNVLAPLAGSASDNPDFLWSLGSALIANGKLREGVDAVERVARQSNAAEAWMVAGQNLLRLSEFVRARDDLETAARLNPNLPGVQTSLGQAREKNADYQGAISAFRKGVEQNPRDEDAWLGLGSDQYFTRDLDGARASLKQLLTIDSASVPGLYALALVEKSQEKTDRAVADLEQVVKMKPDWIEAHVALAALYFQLHKPAEGARERQIVDRLSEQEQKAGPTPR
ncbi:MAG: tetratricopeptide repeat protein [Bryobacteraceae bacterium]